MSFDRKFYMVAMVIFTVFLFSSNVYATKLIMNAGDGGSIATAPAFDATGELQINRNDTVVFTLTPETNFQVDDLIRGGSAPQNNGSVLTMFPGACTVATTTGVMTCTLTDFIDNFTFDASFAAIPVVASFITDQPSGSEAGVVVQFTDTSEHTDEIQTEWEWYINDELISTEQNLEHTFEVGLYNVTLTVTNNHTGTTDSHTFVGYEAIQPTIAYQASAGPNGSISPSGTLIVNEGTTTTFDITPNEFYQVAEVLVDDVSRGAVPSVTFDLADIADHEIVASFEPIPVVASFSGPSGEITTTDEITFTDMSQGSLTFWNWYIGTELVSTDQVPPAVIFDTAGDYNVTLEVGNAATSNSYSAEYTVISSYSSSPVTVEGTAVGYNTIGEAYNVIPFTGAKVMMKAGEITEDLVFDDFVTFELKGGYDDLFESDEGYTKIKGSVKISHGTVTVSKVIIAPAI